MILLYAKRLVKCTGIEKNQKNACHNRAGTFLILLYAKNNLLHIERFEKCIQENQKVAFWKDRGESKRCLL